MVGDSGSGHPIAQDSLPVGGRDRRISGTGPTWRSRGWP